MKHIKMLGAGSVVAVAVLSASVALAAPLSEEMAQAGQQDL
jgi:hypothetical protein